MNGTLLGPAVCALLLFDVPAATGITSAQINDADPLRPLAFMLGRWKGTSEGQPGAAKLSVSTHAF